MENQPNDTQDTKSIVTIYHEDKIGLPLLALGLDLVPVLLLFINSIARGSASSSLVLLFMLLSPIAGLITGVVSLSRGKGRIGLFGKIIAIIAIVLPLSVVALIVLFFIGVSTGVISLM